MILASGLRALLPLGACAALLSASPAAANELHWKSLEAGATLDGEGVLHVVERQHMVFTGDWNGGERRFDLRPGQEVELHRMTRTDPATGARRELREGSLDALDRYAWFSDRRVRSCLKISAGKAEVSAWTSADRSLAQTHVSSGGLAREGLPLPPAALPPASAWAWRSAAESTSRDGRGSRRSTASSSSTSTSCCESGPHALHGSTGRCARWSSGCYGSS